jgi:hypothetical protein
MATGHTCVTLSSLFKTGEGTPYILCLDINTDVLRV